MWVSERRSPHEQEMERQVGVSNGVDWSGIWPGDVKKESENRIMNNK